jgi:hypothetical protein
MKAKQLYGQLITAIIIATLALYAVLIAGCSPAYKAAKCQKWGVCKTVKDSTHVVIKDSTYYIPHVYTVDGDSAYVFAWMECDSSRQVVIRESEIVNGRYIQLRKEVESGKYKVYVRLPARVDTVRVSVTDHSSTTSEIKVQQVKVNELTSWQRFRLSAFPWFVALLVLIIMYVGWKIYKRF